MIQDPEEYVGCYLDPVEGLDYHGLIEGPVEIVPILIREFDNPSYLALRSSLVEVIWQFRLPDTVPFLKSCLEDSDPEVWKAALDGLVTIGGESGLEAIRSAKITSSADPGKLDWLVEAEEQIEEGGT